MKTTSFRKSLVLTVGMLIGLASCMSDTSTGTYGGGGGTPPPNTVVMTNSTFNPSSITVTKGTTITWTNNDAIVHTSTSNAGLWNTGDIGGGASKTTKFDSVGTFNYFCVYHRSMGMVGSVTVK